MMSPAGFNHRRFASKIAAALENYVARNKTGVATTAEPGFQIAHDPDTVRAPDVAYVRAERVPSGGVKGFFQGPPDLAVEIVSPSDRASEVAGNVQDRLRAGCRMVWVVDPENRTAAVHRSLRDIIVLTAEDTLTAGDLLPEFSLPVLEVFG